MRKINISIVLAIISFWAISGTYGQIKKISFSVAHVDSSSHGGQEQNHNIKGSYDYDDNENVEHVSKFYGNNGNDEGDHNDDYNYGHDKDDYNMDDAKYAYQYGVKDSHTGDVKNHWEIRDGDSVKGVYAFKEADGTRRVVQYTSDKKKGFEATVHKIGHVHK
ncbi:pro-resilin-like [Musca vetustissima]|uniref:pro-resilin-like n=1 Tax=Musca vetustissima TaxID=27455 RepID=UPI002AB7EDB2|nr:pro-resilin-like [Musca vetustissima]